MNDHQPPPEAEPIIPPEYRLSTYQFHLPAHLIAQQPTAERDASRLLVLHRSSGEVFHHRFRDLPSLVRDSDVLCINETRVTPAALTGRKPTGGRVELLVLNPALPLPSCDGRAVRECIFRAGKGLIRNGVISIADGIQLVVHEVVGPGRARIVFPVAEAGLLGFLACHGSPPLPPYIKDGTRDREHDRERYQTVFSRCEGSVAAPTAGLHFTPELLGELSARGVSVARILLHVGPGTFLPVRHEDVRLHRMESETYEIDEATAQQLNTWKREGRRIVAVGTTTVRTLESAVGANGTLRHGSGTTALFITPGYRFRFVDNMITNFHLPGSTLLMLVCAFAGTDRVLAAYRTAISERYRFYSYGDACFLTD